jgi:hypothetical protein
MAHFAGLAATQQFHSLKLRTDVVAVLTPVCVTRGSFRVQFCHGKAAIMRLCLSF